jgi:hypothetical protein
MDENIELKSVYWILIKEKSVGFWGLISVK